VNRALFLAIAVAVPFLAPGQVSAAPLSPASAGVVSNAPRYAVWWSTGEASGLVEARAWEPVRLGPASVSLSPAEGYGLRITCGSASAFLQASVMARIGCEGRQITVEATKLAGF
jgi:hypothetical protein